MGLAKLDIWVSAMEDPCGVDDENNWYVLIYDCDGRILNWCDQKYYLLPAKCGHLEVGVPPGVYYIRAVWSYSQTGPHEYYCNHFTDAAIVQASEKEMVSVKLFNPSLHRCGYIYASAIRLFMKRKKLPPDFHKEFEEFMNRILKEVPVPKKRFELEHIDNIEEMIAAQEKHRAK